MLEQVVVVSRNAAEVSALVAELRAPDGPGMPLPPRLAGRDVGGRPPQPTSLAAVAPPLAALAAAVEVANAPATAAAAAGPKKRTGKASKKCNFGVRCDRRSTCPYRHDDPTTTPAQRSTVTRMAATRMAAQVMTAGGAARLATTPGRRTFPAASSARPGRRRSRRRSASAPRTRLRAAR